MKVTGVRKSLSRPVKLSEPATGRARVHNKISTRTASWVNGQLTTHPHRGLKNVGVFFAARARHAAQKVFNDSILCLREREVSNAQYKFLLTNAISDSKTTWTRAGSYLHVRVDRHTLGAVRVNKIVQKAGDLGTRGCSQATRQIVDCNPTRTSVSECVCVYDKKAHYLPKLRDG